MPHPPDRSRKSTTLDPTDELRIMDALEQAAASQDFRALRTRAFVYLLRDGALRTKAAVWLDIENVLKTPAGRRIQILQEAVQRPCEGNHFRERAFVLSNRARDAIAEYLEVARSQGWLADAKKLEGPLWIAGLHKGKHQRLSQRMATEAWRIFLRELNVSRDYQLDDVVLTGRVAFLRAAKGSSEVLSQHAGVSTKWATQYQRYLHAGPSSTVRDALSQLNEEQSRQTRPRKR